MNFSSYYHHRIVDEWIQFRFFYSSDIFHTIVIKSDNQQVKLSCAPIIINLFFYPMENFFSSSREVKENFSVEPMKSKADFSLFLSLDVFFPVREGEREKKLYVHVLPISSLSVCIPVVNLLITENVLHRSQLFRGGAKH